MGKEQKPSREDASFFQRNDVPLWATDWQGNMHRARKLYERGSLTLDEILVYHPGFTEVTPRLTPETIVLEAQTRGHSLKILGAGKEVIVDGMQKLVSPNELRLLGDFFLDHPGRPITREEIQEHLLPGRNKKKPVNVASVICAVTDKFGKDLIKGKSEGETYIYELSDISQRPPIQPFLLELRMTTHTLELRKGQCFFDGKKISLSYNMLTFIKILDQANGEVAAQDISPQLHPSRNGKKLDPCDISNYIRKKFPNMNLVILTNRYSYSTYRKAENFHIAGSWDEFEIKDSVRKPKREHSDVKSLALLDFIVKQKPCSAEELVALFGKTKGIQQKPHNLTPAEVVIIARGTLLHLFTPANREKLDTHEAQTYRRVFAYMLTHNISNWEDFLNTVVRPRLGYWPLSE